MARIVGKGGAVYLGSPLVKVGDIYDWEFSSTGVAFPASIKMDLYDRFSPSHGNAKFTAKRRVNTSAVGMKEVTDMAGTGELLDFRLDLIDANAAFTQITGSGYVTSGGLAAPRGAADDTFEITVDGAWTVTLPGAN